MEKDLLESEAFVSGIAVGINLYQTKVVQAHDRKESLTIDGNLYYLESGQERLERVLSEMCK